MSLLTSEPKPTGVVYPEDDGEPMAETTFQWQWIVTIKENLDAMFAHRPDVFVAGDLLWYPVEGDPKTRIAPDALVVFGRPKGHRGSYMQWEEGGIAPQVVFEVLSPGNRTGEMIRKFKFYERFEVQEYSIYDPDEYELTGYRRQGGELLEIEKMDGWESPLLGVRFDLTKGELVIYKPDGERFLTFAEIAEARSAAIRERDAIARECDLQRERAEKLAAKLRAMGIEPEV
jgi:Uma2 family endonuclease